MSDDTKKRLRKPKQIILDGNTASESPADRWRGLGFVSSSGSSRLLLDYKLDKPEVYDQIMRLLFSPGRGAGITHLKLEMGADINSSSGTEPCTMRTEDEKADVRRGAGFQIAADAKRLYPALTLDLLRWGEPHWVTKAFEDGRENGFAARYRWFRETLAAAFKTYGLEFDFISPDANEPSAPDADWIVYFAEHLRADKDLPFDTSKIRIVASDEVGTRDIAMDMILNERLRDAVDVIGLHYTTFGDKNTKLLHDEYGKEIWYSEGIAPCNVPALSCRMDGSGLAGPNGPIDVANRIMGGWPHGRMVMYEFQPAVSAYYRGSCYAPKQLITADEPWSGHFEADAGLWIAAHFTRFVEPGWRYVESACFGDGEEDHIIRNTHDNYLALVSPEKDQFTLHISNDSSIPRSYLVICRGLSVIPRTVYQVETAGSPDPENVDEDWFSVTQVIRLRAVDGEAAFPVVVAPHSLLTCTTMDVSSVCGTDELPQDIPPHGRLKLPYIDRFEYDPKAAAMRGRAPRYTTDQGGAFELVRMKEGFVLQQQITRSALPTNWRFSGTPAPLTLFGDDHWANCQAVVKGSFGSKAPDNYIGVGIRHNSSVTCPETSLCGFSLRLFTDGKWELQYMDEVLQSGLVPGFRCEGTHQIGIGALGTLVLCFADGHSLYETKLDGRPLVRAGRAAILSGWYKNRFTEIAVQEMPVSLSMPACCARADCLSDFVTYAEDEEHGPMWTFNTMAGYQFYDRTCAIGTRGASMDVRFYGSAISLLGVCETCTMAVWVDGRLYSQAFHVKKSTWREAFLTIEHLHTGWHTLRIQIIEGTMSFDCFEVPGDQFPPDYRRDALPQDPAVSQDASPRKRGEKRDRADAALPLAGVAAAGVAAAFTIGQIGRKLRKKKKK
ncbi:MAG: hypothetical protein IKI21_07980 [Oscillospiraceae bacterium]|nr:hypothetical protein [Oscillospiraceae bacterium]